MLHVKLITFSCSVKSKCKGHHVCPTCYMSIFMSSQLVVPLPLYLILLFLFFIPLVFLLLLLSPLLPPVEFCDVRPNSILPVSVFHISVYGLPLYVPFWTIGISSFSLGSSLLTFFTFFILLKE